jgi:hypothetical protein
MNMPKYHAYKFHDYHCVERDNTMVASLRLNGQKEPTVVIQRQISLSSLKEVMKILDRIVEENTTI